VKKLFGIILILSCFVVGVQADYYNIPDYSWTFTTVTVNATAKRIAFTKSAGLFIQSVGNDIYIQKNATANYNSFKLANGASVDFENQMISKGAYVTIVAPSATIATCNYIIKQ
jgi:hypothetical protein